MSGPQGIQTAGSQLEAAVSILLQGGLVAFPTDTLYALGAHALMEKAVRRVYEVKGRPKGMALPLLLADAEAMEMVAVNVPQAAWDMAERFWPGALTLILPKAQAVSSIVSAGRETVAVRVPNHPLALRLIQAVGAPLTGTSANRSGGKDPATAEEVRRQLGDEVDMILDGGACPLEKSSTIVDMTQCPPKIVREGAVPASLLARVCQNIQGGR